MRWNWHRRANIPFAHRAMDDGKENYYDNKVIDHCDKIIQKTGAANQRPEKNFVFSSYYYSLP